MTRIQDFYNELKTEMEYDINTVRSGLSSGEIILPEYACFTVIGEDAILFDAEEGDQNHWSAISLRAE